MASAQTDDDMFDEFLAQRGHETESAGWEESYNKKQCPDCGGLHASDATACSICGWSPV
ncbi:HVO_0416 family zinc finger protein [Halovenus salina]|uniref:HVO_0416 family zinc finger protein n=1 Tax=Halovenus salina TaxID=1510225 RepID=A0ABD5W670_9EURY|nr:HVO_0416 family zinc finger protein [Halovenus salina]